MITPSYKNYSGTTIRPEKTQADISAELARYGIHSVQHTNTEKFFSVAFQAQVEGIDRPLTIRIDVPYEQDQDVEDRYGLKTKRIKYRALYYYVKAMLIAWDDGLKTFAEIFLPHIVLPGGKTVVQDLLPKYALAAASGQMPEIKLLPEAE
jgi:hypothetical protein